MSHLDDCEYCAEHGLRVISGLSPEHNKELIDGFDSLIEEKVLTEAAVAEIFVMLNHEGFKFIRSGSQQDRGIHRVTYGDYLAAMKKSSFDVRAGEASESNK